MKLESPLAGITGGRGFLSCIVVDRLFNEVCTVLVKRIHASMEDAEQAMDIMMVAKYLERIGDHAVNISEWVEFSITGTYKNSRVL